MDWYVIKPTDDYYIQRGCVLTVLSEKKLVNVNNFSTNDTVKVHRTQWFEILSPPQMCESARANEDSFCGNTSVGSFQTNVNLASEERRMLRLVGCSIVLVLAIVVVLGSPRKTGRCRSPPS